MIRATTQCIHAVAALDPAVDSSWEHAGCPPRRDILPARLLARQQRRHFLAVHLPSALGALACLHRAATGRVGAAEVWLLLVMWALTCLGISVGFHRLFSHRAFSAGSLTRAGLAIAGSMAGQGPLIYWVALHRKHHQSSDREGDPHSPVPRAGGWSARLASLWHAHVGWVLHHDVPAPQRYARDACADRLQVFVSRTYALWVALGLLLPALIGGCVLRSWEGALGGLLWGGLGRLFLVNNLIWSVNSVGHAFGTRPHDTGDQSRNNALLALVSFGEGLHNNHHASPRSARFAASRGHLLLDLGYVFLSILASIGAARALEQRGAGQR